jgi:Thaumatin family
VCLTKNMKRFAFFLCIFLLSACGCFGYNAYITSKSATTQLAVTPSMGTSPAGGSSVGTQPTALLSVGKQPPIIPYTGGPTRAFTFVNHTGQTIWVGTQGSVLLNNGGWKLDVGQVDTIPVPNSWSSGRFWGRTECTFDSSGAGSCATGDCGGHLQCNGAGGVPPASLAEFTLSGGGGNDFYDISYVDGFNVPVIITTSNTPSSSDPYRCGDPGCPTDINAICPSQLQKKDAGGKVVACTNSPGYAQLFKKACPTAYSYPYDDATSTFTCHNCNYQITFGPLGSS